MDLRTHLPTACAAALVIACGGSTPMVTSGSATDTDTDTDTDSSSTSSGSGGTTTTGSGTTTTASGSASDSASGTGMNCVPGMSVACACPDGGSGAQVCDADGQSFGPCMCEGSSDATTADPTTTDPTTTDSTTTGDPTTTTDGTTTGNNAACDDVVVIEMMPSEATLAGGWQLGMSMMGEGEIVFVQNPADDNAVLFEPELPCDDTWYIWARALDQGSDDSYFATLDGEPVPPAIFEGDCQGGGNGYLWARLNWRDEGAPPCEYVEDPWAPTWTAGAHAIEFSFRESQAMGRILITNDPDLVPQ